MSPRKYESGKRQAAAEETRRRVLAAARDLLAGPGVTIISPPDDNQRLDPTGVITYQAVGQADGFKCSLDGGGFRSPVYGSSPQPTNIPRTTHVRRSMRPAYISASRTASRIRRIPWPRADPPG